MSTINTKLFATFVLMGGALVAQAEETTQNSSPLVKAEVFQLKADGTCAPGATSPKLSMTLIDKNLNLLIEEDIQPYNHTCPKINMLDPDTPSWTLKYKLENISDANVDMNSVTLYMYAMRSGEFINDTGESYIGYQSISHLASLGISLTFTDASENKIGDSYALNPYIQGGADESGTNGGASSAELKSFTIDPGSYVTMTVTVDAKYIGTSHDDLYVGIRTVDFNGKIVTPEPPPGGSVPEPTSATLSLLALAGLAARRRRK